MTLYRHAALASVFVGGCLSGAAALSLFGVPQSAEQLASRSPSGAHQAPRESEFVPVRVERSVVEAPPAQVRTIAPDDAQALEQAEPSRSAGEVLAYLEAAYQEQVAATARVDSEPVPESSDARPQAPEPDPGDAQPPEAEIAVKTEQQDARVENEVAVVLNQTDTHESAAHHGDLVLGDKFEGSKVNGDVHVGDVTQVTQVSQVALVYQPVFLVPPEATRRAAKARPGAGRLPPVNPFGSVTISAQHDPWKTELGKPGSPWSSVGPLPR